MIFRASLSSSENSGPEEDVLLPPEPIKTVKHKKKRALDPVYVPYNEDLDSVDGDDANYQIQNRTSQKRKLNPEVTDADYSSSSEESTSSQLRKKIKTSEPPKIVSPKSTSPALETNRPPTPTNGGQNLVVPPLETRLKSPTPSPKSRKKAKFEDQNYESDNSEDEDQEGRFRISRNEKTTVVFDFSREKAKRMAEAINIPTGIYTEREKALFLQLAMRGFEPFAPKHWKIDFPTLPDSLFSSPKKQSQPIIQTSNSTTFYAVKSLANLFSLSGRVRDCSIVRKHPETLIKQTIKRYIRWALYDVDLEINSSSVPVHVICTQKKHEHTLAALKRLNKRLKKLALRHHSALTGASSTVETDLVKRESSVPPTENLRDRLPLLIGFMICGPIVAILTFDLDPLRIDENTEGKFISQFDLAERGQDVWNSLAIAIGVMHIRNTMTQLSRDGIGGFGKSRKRSPSNEDL